MVDLLERRPDLASLVPEGVDPYTSGKDLLEKHPKVASVLSDSVIAEISALPQADLLLQRADLLRFLPLQKLGQESGKELFQKDPKLAETIADQVKDEIEKLPSEETKWGMIGVLGLNRKLATLDDHVRSPFIPFGISGIMAAAAAVFFAYIGFDSISTHSEEAKKPQRDVPFGIIASLILCSVLYFGVSAVVTGMEPYPVIDPDAAVAVAFHRLSVRNDSVALQASTALIAIVPWQA